MKLTDFNYLLPKENIAHKPNTKRDHAKLMILNRQTGAIFHKHFFDLPSMLTSNDVLVLNNTKVFPARLFGKKSTGGKVEVLLLKELEINTWEVLGKSIPAVSDEIFFDTFSATVIKKIDTSVVLRFNTTKAELLHYIEQKGHMPLPPYIQSALPEEKIREEYQTVYAKTEGSVAAPTAGLHFTKELLAQLQQTGIQIEYVTLHVGAGTFLPIKEDHLENHTMHSEFFSVDPGTVDRLNAAKREGKRIISVGTTTTRVLETLATDSHALRTTDLTGTTDIFMYPPYQFKFVDSLITNFHLPHSTLLALVSALVSKPNTEHAFTTFEESSIGHAYKEAIRNNYKFYSFGDGMMIG